MEKLHKSQFLKIALIVLLLITPLLSTSMRTPYLYLLFNLLIIALGAESGILGGFSSPMEDKKPVVISPVAVEASWEKGGGSTISNENEKGGGVTAVCNSSTGDQPMEKTEKPSTEKKIKIVRVHAVKKCPSTPSLFFIGGGEDEKEEDLEEEGVGVINRQELFTKAEAFIGNFYKQLKIQREESWKKIHGFYQGAF